MDAVEALDEFSFLKDEKKKYKKLNQENPNDKWAYDQSALDQVKEQFRYSFFDLNL